MSLETTIYVLVFTFIGSILSLAGGLILLKRRLWEGENSVLLLSFAAGVLLATAFLDLLPEALRETKQDPNIFLAALLGLVTFFFLERFFVAFHPHEQDQEKLEGSRRKSIVSLILFGDGFHNFIDGFAIASSFLVSVPIGITTSLAVATHEIPQEISDFTILLRSDLGAKKVIFFNILSGMTAILGALLALFLSELISPYLGLILAFTSGMFIYIAASDIIPELQHLYLRDRKFHQAIFFVVGVVAVYATIKLLHV
ncbi:MAG: ZIP family metal transporter [bacterium]|nr:ZIP family metal transporter [bacterium]